MEKCSKCKGAGGKYEEPISKTIFFHGLEAKGHFIEYKECNSCMGSGSVIMEYLVSEIGLLLKMFPGTKNNCRFEKNKLIIDLLFRDDVQLFSEVFLELNNSSCRSNSGHRLRGEFVRNLLSQMVYLHLENEQYEKEKLLKTDRINDPDVIRFTNPSRFNSKHDRYKFGEN